MFAVAVARAAAVIADPGSSEEVILVSARLRGGRKSGKVRGWRRNDKGPGDGGVLAPRVTLFPNY